MTTKIKVENDLASNGDLHIVKSCGFGDPVKITLLPGQTYEEWVSTGHVMTIQETWPTVKKAAPPAAPASAPEPAAPDPASDAPAPAAPPYDPPAGG